MKQLRKAIIIFCWLLVWAFVSRIIQNKILLAGPIETLQALCKLVTTGPFWNACLGTILRIAIGYLAGMLLGILLAAFSAGRSWMEEILAPVITLMKAVPVASFTAVRKRTMDRAPTMPRDSTTLEVTAMITTVVIMVSAMRVVPKLEEYITP